MAHFNEVIKVMVDERNFIRVVQQDTGNISVHTLSDLMTNKRYEGCTVIETNPAEIIISGYKD